MVTFDGTDQEFDAGVMDALLETEVAADEALQSADARRGRNHDVDPCSCRAFEPTFVGVARGA